MQKSGEISKDAYDEWRYRYSEKDTSRIHAAVAREEQGFSRISRNLSFLQVLQIHDNKKRPYRLFFTKVSKTVFLG